MSDLPEIKDLDILLEKHFQKKIKILDRQTKLLTAPGENYGSIMVALGLKIEIENKEEDLHLVAKHIPKNELLREIFAVQMTFIKELRVYTKIVPTYIELENEYGITENRASDLFAKCYGGRSNLEEIEGKVTDDSVLLFENLKLQGFATGDRLKGCDFETASFILQNLARFHATPIALKRLKPHIHEEIVYKTICPQHQIGAMDKDNNYKFAKGLKDIIYQEKYSKQAEKMFEDMLFGLENGFIKSALQTDPNQFITFIHADFWTNNMMLKTENNKPVQVIIVDFQTPQNHSLVSDLLFFMYSSVSPSILYDRVDELIKIYYDSFIGRLQEFNLELNDFSWDAFTKEIKSAAPRVLCHILLMYKPILLERGHIEDMNKFKEDDLLDLSSISDHCKNVMRRSFEQFCEKDWA